MEVGDTLTVRDDDTIGRSRGDLAFVIKLERKADRSLTPGKRGPKAKKGITNYGDSAFN